MTYAEELIIFGLIFPKNEKMDFYVFSGDPGKL
jgi:hypothetical protein